MPVLKNQRHERFAQLLASGLGNDVAYVQAGYVSNQANAARLKGTEPIRNRVAEILGPAAAKLTHAMEVTVERIVEQARRIAEADLTEMVSIEDGKVVVKDTADLPAELRTAIAGIRATKEGGIEVKLHDKLGALNLLGKHKGMFKENINLNVTVSLADLVNASFGTQPKQIDGEKA